MAWRTGSLGGLLLFFFCSCYGLVWGGAWERRAGVFERLASPLFSFKKNEVPSHGAWSWGIAVVIEEDNVVK